MAVLLLCGTASVSAQAPDYCRRHPRDPRCIARFEGGASPRYHRRLSPSTAAPGETVAPAQENTAPTDTAGPAEQAEPAHPEQETSGPPRATRPFHHGWSRPAPTRPGPRIVDTGYTLLAGLGGEENGYGLYSYAIITSQDATRASAFVDAVATTTARASDLTLDRALINVLYIPGKASAVSGVAGTSGAVIYDYTLAHNLIGRICSSAAVASNPVCQGDMSQGPYVFTYAGRIGSADQLEPPYLLADFSTIHPKAFPTLLSAFKQQVKTGPLGATDKLSNLRLSILNVVLKASDWITPMHAAVADIVHAELPGKDK